MSDEPTTDERRILEKLTDLYAPREAREWLETPQELLGGRSARELIAEGRLYEVEAVVDRLRDSVYL